jgi:hypothetical protein
MNRPSSSLKECGGEEASDASGQTHSEISCMHGAKRKHGPSPWRIDDDGQHADVTTITRSTDAKWGEGGVGMPHSRTHRWEFASHS